MESLPDGFCYSRTSGEVIAICAHLYDTCGRVPCHISVRLDFGAFTCNLLGSNFVRLLFTVSKEN
jgi:hypothetical protein